MVFAGFSIQRCNRSPSSIYFLGRSLPPPAEQCACAFPKGTTCQPSRVRPSHRDRHHDSAAEYPLRRPPSHQGRGAKREVAATARLSASQTAREGEARVLGRISGPHGCRPGARVDIMDMVGDGEGAHLACMTSRHSSDLPHAGPSSWSVVASHWGSCEMGRPVTPMHAVRDGVWRRPTAPPEWTRAFAGPAS